MSRDTITDQEIERTTPHGMWRYGRDFCLAMETVQNNHNADRFMPFFFLAYQSIELSLKAFLLKKGVEVQELKGSKYGHDIESIIDAALERDIERHVELEDAQIAAIKVAGEEYKTRRFQYIRTGSMLVPEPLLLSEAAKSLTRDLEVVCCKPRNSS